MRITKKIQKLAESEAKNDLKTLTSFTEEDLPRLSRWNAEEMVEIKKALLNGKFYIGVESVSASGMSRTIKIAYIKNNKLHGVTETIYKLAGCDKNRRITGCGMDMLFAAQYNLFCELCPDHDYTKTMKRYNSL